MDNDVSQVIERTSVIENLLDQVISKYISPRKEVFNFVWFVLLDSSVIDIGKKAKMINYIAQKLDIKIESQPLHEIIKYRNAFAHHSLNSHPTLFVGQSPEEDKAVYQLQIITSSGKIEKITRNEAYIKFNNNFDLAKESLLYLLKEMED